MKQPDLPTEIDMIGRMMIALEEIEACREFDSFSFRSLALTALRLASHHLAVSCS